MSVDVELELRPVVLDELAVALAKVPPLGAWVEQASCADLGCPEVFTPDTAPEPADLAVLVRVCTRCPVQQECAGYALSAPVYGVWGARWHSGRSKAQRAA